MKSSITLLLIQVVFVRGSFLNTIDDNLWRSASKLFDNDLGIYVFSSTDPNPKFLPEIGNGHIATQIKNRWMFLNGLYNGQTVNSHRACVPSTNNWNIRTKDKLIKTIYSFDSIIGLYKEIFIYSLYNVSVSSFISRNIRQIMVRNVSLETSDKNMPVLLYTTGNQVYMHSPDVDFSKHELGNTVIWQGSTKIPENKNTTKLPVYVMFDEVPNSFSLNSSYPWRAFITAIDDNAVNTIKAFNTANSERFQLLYQHAKTWLDIWDDGIIQVTDSDVFLMQSVHSCQYYILSSLPFKNWTKSDSSWFYYGISPGGLAHGKGDEDYMGHVFWDMDTWIYPAILPFHRDVAIEMMKYRLAMLNSAIQHSKNTGYAGARYPWESARTGFETSPSKICSNNEIHVTAEISYAVQQLLWIEPQSEMTLYNLFSKTILENIARFWASRISFNPTKKSFDILGVMPPDEYVHDCNNSAFTNSVARLALEAPVRVAKRFGATITSEMLSWYNLGQNLSFPTDKKRQLILEHDSYKIGSTIKQADVVLLLYPLQIDAEHEYLVNSQTYYEKVTDVHGPAMTWAIYSINWFNLNNTNKAEDLFTKNYKYINLPFYVWSESINGQGAINFLTGMGGYLQNIINGFLGMRLELSGKGQMIFSPSKSTVIGGLMLHNLKFQGANINLKYNNQIVTLQLINDAGLRVFAYQNESTYILNGINKNVTFPIQRFVLTKIN